MNTEQLLHNFFTIEGTYSIDHEVVSVDGNISLNVRCERLPVKFGDVSGDFSCNSNSLTSLNGCPKRVGNRFNCFINPITSLIGGPSSVGEDFNCFGCNLYSLEGCAENIGGDFYCTYNPLKN